jgi:hypothetical protein
MEDDHGLFENAGLPNNNFVAGNTGRVNASKYFCIIKSNGRVKLLWCFVMIFGGGTCSRGKESTFKFGCYKKRALISLSPTGSQLSEALQNQKESLQTHCTWLYESLFCSA